MLKFEYILTCHLKNLPILKRKFVLLLCLYPRDFRFLVFLNYNLFLLHTIMINNTFFRRFGI